MSTNGWKSLKDFQEPLPVAPIDDHRRHRDPTAMNAVDQSKVLRGRRWMGASDDKRI
jgi:hypothetical protein